MTPLPTPEPEVAMFNPQIAEVRYSLPALLAELQLERTSGSFAMEKLNQVEITKVFRSKKKVKPRA